MAIINRQEVLSYLATSELAALTLRYRLDVGPDDGRSLLIEALANTDKATLGQMLMTLSRSRLKELCRERGCDGSGREKVMIATRLLGVDPMAAPTPPAVPPVKRRARARSKA
jgi:hypothetical protein